MTATAAPADRWSLLDPPGAVRVAVTPRGARRRRDGDLAHLTPGTMVVLCDGRPGAPRRCRRFARRHGLIVERQYVILPSLGRAAIRVEDTPSARAYFCSTLLTVPPGAGPLTWLLDGAVSLGRVLGRSRLLGALAPGREVIARCP